MNLPDLPSVMHLEGWRWRRTALYAAVVWLLMGLPMAGEAAAITRTVALTPSPIPFSDHLCIVAGFRMPFAGGVRVPSFVAAATAMGAGTVSRAWPHNGMTDDGRDGSMEPSGRGLPAAILVKGILKACGSYALGGDAALPPTVAHARGTRFALKGKISRNLNNYEKLLPRAPPEALDHSPLCRPYGQSPRPAPALTSPDAAPFCREIPPNRGRSS
jgi:hypothetical protein